MNLYINKSSKILILGSFPSVKSREANFFYHHPQNRFWKILANIYNTELPETIIEKKEFLINQHIAVWDVIASCEIKGSSDSSITNVEVNDLKKIIDQSQITHIYTNGNLADRCIIAISMKLLIFLLLSYHQVHQLMRVIL